MNLSFLSVVFVLLVPVVAAASLLFMYVRRGGASAWLPALGALVMSLPLGLLTYGVVGIGIARYRQVGRFYSVPFGGYTVRDAPIIASVLTWTALCFATTMLLLLSLRRHHDER